MGNKFYVGIIALLFAAFVIVFNVFPRSTVSELEKRELATFPDFSWERLADGSYTRDISTWFSDSEPYRDMFMMLSMYIKDLEGIAPDEDNITFHASTDGNGNENENEDENGNGNEFLSPVSEEERDSLAIDEYENHINADENAKISNAGIIIVGKGDKVRALMAYGGSARGCTGYAQAANKYKEVFGDKVNIYCMVIPTAIEFYCPDKAKKRTKSQLATIRNVFDHLDAGVKPVDIYTTLGQHADEDIYLRTDHHWAPLGGYYAAEAFAKVAGVPFRNLDSYDEKVVHRFLGTMYSYYTHDPELRNNPEDFVYFVPRDVDYKTTYINYSMKGQTVVGASQPKEGPFFHNYKDGSSGAYCTFMGGDAKITKVETSTGNGRRLLILKDSFGNALPGYFFYSFEQIHVVDSRYFKKNIVKYINDNQITDVLFCNCIGFMCDQKISNNLDRYLTQ